MGQILQASCAQCGFSSPDIFAGGGFLTADKDTCDVPACCINCVTTLR